MDNDLPPPKAPEEIFPEEVTKQLKLQQNPSEIANVLTSYL